MHVNFLTPEYQNDSNFRVSASILYYYFIILLNISNVIAVAIPVQPSHYAMFGLVRSITNRDKPENLFRVAKLYDRGRIPGSSALPSKITRRNSLNLGLGGHQIHVYIRPLMVL